MLLYIAPKLCYYVLLQIYEGRYKGLEILSHVPDYLYMLNIDGRNDVWSKKGFST